MTAGSQAVRHWARQFEQVRSDGPSWLADLRPGAFERFAEAGFPGRKTQGWRHTNVRRLAQTAFEVDKGDAAPIEPGALPVLEGAAARVVFVDGRLRDDLSDLGDLDIGSLRDAGDELSTYLQAEDGRPNASFVDLNAALVEGGAVIRIPANTRLDGPVHVVHATTATGELAATTLRHVVVAGRGSEAAVVEHYVGPDDHAAFTNVVTEVTLEANAVLHHTRIQEEGDEAYHVAELHVRQGRDSRFTSFSFATGGKLSRVGLQADLDAPGAECELLGVYLGRERQHVDHTTLVRHNAPHCTSDEAYRGILDERSRGVFSGMVYVAPDAQKTVAEQSNRNLLLSDDAHADSEPMLEIHADDVRCAHGSAIGRLDDEALFYLRSRGIDAAQAQRLLTRAFAAEVIERLDDGPLRAMIEQRMTAWLAHLEEAP